MNKLQRIAHIRKCRLLGGGNPVRFWVWINNGWVKLRLEPGQVIRWGQSGPTDEGWSYVSYQFEYDIQIDVIKRTAVSGGCDCDGPIDRVTEYECHFDRLKANWNEKLDDYVPEWDECGGLVRDLYAERAGY